MSYTKKFIKSNQNLKSLSIITIKALTSFMPENISWQESKKIIPIFSLFFIISFVYHILRCLKVTLIVKASGCGTEVIPFIKFWLVMPSTVLFTYIYAKLARNNNRKVLIYSILSIFITFFTLFLITFIANKGQLNFHLGYNISTCLPLKLYQRILPIINNLPQALFYIMAEMWSIIVLSLLFWGFCNEVTKIDDAKRFYVLIALGANCAGIVSGKFMQIISKSIASSWEESMSIFMITIIASCFIIMFIFNQLNNIDLLNNSPTNTNITKHKISLTESIKYIFRYKYIALLSLIVISYNIVFNLAEVLWLDQLNQRLSSIAELNNYLAQLDFLVGIFCIIISIFIFTKIMNKFGWTVTALITPAVWLITSIILFICLSGEKSGFALNNFILISGTLQIALGKALKYSLFDQIKEMSFIPLSIEQQRNSKVVVDGLISRLGKSSSSIILQALLIFGVNSITEATTIITILIIITIMIWSYSVLKIGKYISNNSFLE
jgi:ATP:ADP antiporter, AAA family